MFKYRSEISETLSEVLGIDFTKKKVYAFFEVIAICKLYFSRFFKLI